MADLFVCHAVKAAQHIKTSHSRGSHTKFLKLPFDGRFGGACGVVWIRLWFGATVVCEVSY
jgi:hypothetical protein